MGIFSEMLVCGDITVTTKLTCCHAVNQIGTLWLHSTWQQLLYTVVASILVPSAASCRIKLCRVKSVSS